MTDTSTMARATPLDGALWLVRHGFAVFPADHPGLVQCAGIGRGHDSATCTDRGKHPAVPFTKAHTRDEDQVRRDFDGEQLRNVGIFVGACTGPHGEQLLVVDSDRVGAIEDAARALGQQHTPTMRVFTAKGYHDYYWAPTGAQLGNRLGALQGKFDGDVRAGNAFVIGPGSVHATGVSYELEDADQPPVALPEWLLTALQARPAPAPAAPTSGIVIQRDRHDAYTRKVLQAEADAIAAAPDGDQNNAINRAAFNVGTLVGAGALSEGEARQTLLAAARAGNHPEGRAHAAIDSGLTAGIAQPRTPWPPVARADSWPTANDFSALVSTTVTPPPATDGEKTTPAAKAKPETYSRTDDGNALRLVDKHEHNIRYVPQRGKWLRWDGHRWAWDEAGTVRELSRAIARALPNGEGEAKHRARSLSAAGISAMVSMAQTDPRIVAHAADLDAHRMLLNTPSGAVDLTTGAMIAPDPKQMHTRSTSIAPDAKAPTPKWDQFLAQTFGGDNELLRYVQRMAGYSASGSVKWHILPFLHGGGGNGKGVFLNVLRNLLGDYAATAPNSFLMAGAQRHETEIARLHGLRLVIASEVNQEAKFDEAKVKELTGGDGLTARFMRQDHFTFEPTHKLWLMGNHQPRVSAGGKSFWRRLRLMPFVRTPDKVIEDLDLLLISEEGPGILAWVIAGAVDVFANGLRDPDSVKAATAQYAAEEDALARFLEEACHVGGGVHVRTATEVFRTAYERWCRAEGEEPMPSRQLGRELKDRFQIIRKPSNGTYSYINVALNAPADDRLGDDK
ncbi:phage/plasmid primase, P4 family [Streptomyces sp. NPDC056227]|uniref:phage/plasmid primase, P4 family n=1 Tax=Streptomyces sp. NPDC056227 TaxID=3345753 RepID=UPI0035DA24B3